MNFVESGIEALILGNLVYHFCRCNCTSWYIGNSVLACLLYPAMVQWQFTVASPQETELPVSAIPFVDVLTPRVNPLLTLADTHIHAIARVCVHTHSLIPRPQIGSGDMQQNSVIPTEVV